MFSCEAFRASLLLPFGTFRRPVFLVFSNLFVAVGAQAYNIPRIVSVFVGRPATVCWVLALDRAVQTEGRATFWATVNTMEGILCRWFLSLIADWADTCLGDRSLGRFGRLCEKSLPPVHHWLVSVFEQCFRPIRLTPQTGFGVPHNTPANAGRFGRPTSGGVSVSCACRKGDAPRRRRFSHLEISPMSRPAVYTTNSVFVNTISYPPCIYGHGRRIGRVTDN